MNKEKLEFFCNAVWFATMMFAASFHLNKFFANANFGHLLWSIIYIIAAFVVELRLSNKN